LSHLPFHSGVKEIDDLNFLVQSRLFHSVQLVVPGSRQLVIFLIL